MENNIGAYIEARSLTLLQDAEVLISKIEKGGEKIQSLVNEVKARKRANPETTFVDVKDLLVEVKLEHYNNVFLDAEIKRTVTILGENFSILKAFDQGKSFTEEANKKLEHYLEMSRPVFVVNNGDVKPADEETHNSILAKISETSEDDKEMEKFFNGPNFSIGVE